MQLQIITEWKNIGDFFFSPVQRTRKILFFDDSFAQGTERSSFISIEIKFSLRTCALPSRHSGINGMEWIKTRSEFLLSQTFPSNLLISRQKVSLWTTTYSIHSYLMHRTLFIYFYKYFSFPFQCHLTSLTRNRRRTFRCKRARTRVCSVVPPAIHSRE